MEQSKTSDKCAEYQTRTPRLTRASTDRFPEQKIYKREIKGREIKTT
jgi:hypothetical protein